MKYKAKYLCLRCNCKWVQDVGIAACPTCGHLYVKWTNYEQIRKKSKAKRPAYGW